MKFATGLLLILFSCVLSHAQVPMPTLLQIVKAEDRRAYDTALEALMTDPAPAIRARTALAAGRIGDKRAVPALGFLLSSDTVTEVRAMAAFAIGEVESVDGAGAILKVLEDDSVAAPVRARAVEAAGKIAAANPKDPVTQTLGKAIIATLEREHKAAKFDRDTVLLGLTALLRTRPKGSDVTAARFLTSTDPRVRADAGNTMTRIKAKNANQTLRKMVSSDPDPIARANAARALGAAEDKDAVGILITAAAGDADARVRISAIRSLAAINDVKAADTLLKRGEELLAAYAKAKRPKYIPVEQNEFSEIAVALGRLLANKDDQRADKLLADFGKLDKGHTPEVYIARVRIGPKRAEGKPPELTDWRQYSTLAQIVGEFAVIEPKSEVGKQMKSEAPGIIRPLAKAFAEANPATEGKRMLAGPDALQAFARFKTADLAEVLRTALRNKDVQMRATAAGLIAELPESKENIEALDRALNYALANDTDSNDAQLALIDALDRSDKTYILQKAAIALDSKDYLVRRKIAEVLKAKGVNFDPQQRPLDERVYPLRPYKAGSKSKQGVILNTDADYRRAVLRRNGSVKAIVTTDKGPFTIVFDPEEAPLTVDNFIKLAKTGYFNGVEVHRVVPNFVMQDGDPRGDGNGGPGWSIRCEVNTLPYDRGAVGMALSGKDTGGSQWFVTHSPQPHLDGGYTVFGHVNESDMKVVDQIVRGDRIISIRIVEQQLSKGQKSR